ncbi:MAG: hypothetical protein KAS75_02335 [Planctomycetes bacterium]|nr:hypothetical protein [Planctomycetota bacterium]
MVTIKKAAGVLVLVGMMMLCSGAASQKEGEVRTVTVQGVVNVKTDANDYIIGVSLVTEDITYEVVLDEKGDELSDYIDLKVEVKGTVAEKDGQKWLTVLTIKELEE